MGSIGGGGENNGTGTGTRELHIMMFPFFGFGHISPFIQLSRKITAVDSSIRITFLSSPGAASRVSSLLPSLPSVSVHSLTLPQVSGLPPGIDSTADMTPPMAELLKLAIDLTQPQIFTLLSTLKPDIIIHDFSQPWLPSISHPYGIKTLFFSVFACVATAYLTVPSRLSTRETPSVVYLKSPPAGFPSKSSIKGVPTYQAENFSYIFKSFNGLKPVYDRVVSCLRDSSAILIKSCMEMEGHYIDYFSSQFDKKPILLAGPIVPEPPASELDKNWANWLNDFEKNSVIYCSFGSETFLSDEEIRELLLGLESTNMPFLVVLNFPPSDSGESPEDILKKKTPEGFSERVGDRGRVKTGWVQQQQLLSHNSVGYYFCHAGLSSVIEGVVAGCQIILMPQKGDQFLNAELFAGDLGLGVIVERDDEDGKFTAAAVSSALKKVAEDEEGEKVREKNKEWREFFMDEELQTNFIVGLVDKLKNLASS